MTECREPEVRTTFAASPIANFGFKAALESCLLVSLDSEVRNGACGKLGRTSESGHYPRGQKALIPVKFRQARVR